MPRPPAAPARCSGRAPLTKNAPAAGGTGQMYFDDIRLYRPAE
jgi:hypothetical protein